MKIGMKNSTVVYEYRQKTCRKQSGAAMMCSYASSCSSRWGKRAELPHSWLANRLQRRK